MPQVRFNGCDAPVIDIKGIGQLLIDMRFGYPVLRCAAAMGVHIAAGCQGCVAQPAFGLGHGFCHGQVVANARVGYRFFVAVGMNKYITDAAVDR